MRRGMRFHYPDRTDVVGLSCVNDDNQKIGIVADKLTGVQIESTFYL